jgi:catecholate siderophore receptor
MGALVATTSIGTGTAAARETRNASQFNFSPASIAHHRFVLPSEALPPWPYLDGDGALNSQQPVLTFNVPPGTLREVIAAIARVTGFSIRASRPELLDIPSPGVSGRFTPSEAIVHALDGTGVAFHLTGAHSAQLDIAGLSESVDVAGEAAPLSSPKYTQPLENTPQTIVVIPAAVLQQQQVTTLSDALRNTPGITLHAGEGGSGAGDNIYIRGFSAANDVYIDGVRDPGVLSRDMFAVENVEVAKGPSSVTTGRGSAGGSVNLVTKQAQFTDFGTVQFNGGSADDRRGTIDVNRTVNDSVAFRFNGMWQDSGVPRRDVVDNEAWGVAPSVSFRLGTATQVTVNYEHVHQHNIPDYGLPGTLPELADAAGITVDDLDFSNYYGLANRDHQITDSDVVSGIVEHQFSPRASLRNLTRFGRNTLDLVVTPPRAASASNGGLDPGYDPTVPQIRRTDTKYRNLDDRTVTNQTDLTTMFRTGRARHTLVTGLELTREDQPAYSVADTYANGRPPVTSLFAPNPYDPYTPSIERTGATSQGIANTVAPYAFDTVELGDRWQVDGGVRWDHVVADYTAVNAPAAGETVGETTRFSRTDQAASGRAGVVFKPAQRGSLYAAFSTSFVPLFDGAWGLTLTDSGRNANVTLPPQKSRNLELGTKWQIAGDRLLFTTAFFQTDMTNAKTTDDAGNAVLAGDQQVRGVEFDVSGSLNRRWSLFSGLSVMHSEVQASGNPDEVGRQLAYVPKVSFSLWSAYALPGDVTVGAGAQYSDGYFFDNTNDLSGANRAAIQDLTKYWVFQAMASYDVTRHLRLQLNVANLTDARYVDRGYSGHFIPGAGRAIVFSPVWSF